MTESDFHSWLEKTQKQRDALFAYAREEMPTEAVLIGGDIERAMRAELAAGLQCVDADFFLTQETARAVLKYRGDDSLSAKERDIIVKDSVKDTKRLRDSLELLREILVARRIAGFGARKNQQ